MDSTSICIFDQNMGMGSAQVGLRCSWISLLLILFDQNMESVCAKIKLRCSCTWMEVRHMECRCEGYGVT